MQLAVADDRQISPVWSPDGKWIVWQQDRGGNEAYDLYAIPASGGAPVNLTNTPNVSETSALFSPDSKWLALDYKPTATPQTDVAVLDLEHESRPQSDERKDRRPHLERRGLEPRRRARSTRIARIPTARWARSIASTSPPAAPTTSRRTRSRQTSHASDLSPDGKTLLITTNESGYDNVALLDLATKAMTPVTSLQWEANSGDFSPDGKWLTYTINEDGRTDVYLARSNGTDAHKLALPDGVNGTPGRPSAFSPGRRPAAHLASESATMPGDSGSTTSAPRTRRN